MPFTLDQEAQLSALETTLQVQFDSDENDHVIDALFFARDMLIAEGHTPGPIMCELFARFDMCAEHGCDYDGCRDDQLSHTTEPWKSVDSERVS